jgi:hypothetical protein
MTRTVSQQKPGVASRFQLEKTKKTTRQTEVGFYDRPQPDLLPQEKEQQSLVSDSRLIVRQIQSQAFQ